VMDIPPGADKADAGNALAWSYHGKRFDLVGPARIRGWQRAGYAVRVRAERSNAEAGKLRAFLESRLDAQLLDPDIALADERAPVDVLRLEAKVVQLDTGRIVSLATVSAGENMPWDVLATTVADLVLGRAPSAWVEVHPIPDSATARVDRETVDVVGGAGIVRLRPGKHGADLLLVPGGKAEATASFETHEFEYGVLALATPFGSLEITSTPEKVDVSVDGVAWGSTPVTRTVAGGAHTVTGSLADCGAAVTQQVEVLVGQSNQAVVHLNGIVSAQVSPSGFAS